MNTYVPININTEIRFKLTAAGRTRLLLESTRYLTPETEFLRPAVEAAANLVDEEGYTRMSLWKVINTFGADCFMGSNRLPFVGNTIEIPAPGASAEAKGRPDASSDWDDWVDSSGGPRTPGPCPTCGVGTARKCEMKNGLMVDGIIHRKRDV
jgi:hypothetical protein